MTGYGRSVITNELGQFTAEVQTLNRKHLEIVVSLPDELQRFEVDIRGWVAARVMRGRVQVNISVKYSDVIPISVSANLPLAKKIKSVCDQIADALHLSNREQLLTSVLIENKKLLMNEEMRGEEEIYRSCLQEVTFSALEMLNDMRLAEGKQLEKDIRDRLELIAIHLQDVVNFAPQQKQTYRQKLENILQEFLLGTSQDEARIIQEVCLFAERVDISEEITRLCSHQQQFLDRLELNESIGKRLEFLIQEMFRECSTIAAKSVDVKIIHHIIDMKTELERIKEQIQNVE